MASLGGHNPKIPFCMVNIADNGDFYRNIKILMNISNFLKCLQFFAIFLFVHVSSSSKFEPKDDAGVKYDLKSSKITLCPHLPCRRTTGVIFYFLIM